MRLPSDLACCACRLHRRRGSVKHGLGLVLVLSLVCLYYLLYRSQGLQRHRVNTELQSRKFCDLDPQGNIEPLDDLTYWSGNQVRVLFFSAGGGTNTNRDLKELLGLVRVKYKQTHAKKNLPDMIRLSKGVGKYLVVIFQDIRDYYMMDKWNRELLDKYCVQFRVGIFGFLPSRDEEWKNESIADLSTNLSTPFKVSSTHLVKSVRTTLHPLLRILKVNTSVPYSRHQNTNWVTFNHLEEGVETLVTATADDGTERSLAVIDSGLKDGIVKVVIGGKNSHVLKHWCLKLLLLDSLHHLSRGQISLPLTRYVLVDIDDIFVGTARLLPSDVDAMIASQDKLGRIIKNFRYNLGFSGNSFLQGDDSEDEGDKRLVERREKFWWFPHMWKHLQPHRFTNTTELIRRMEMNKNFAETYKISTNNRYAIAPHHSGVYPVHQPLYSAWRDVWDIAVTSTEEYPNLRPAWRRRGFQYHDISVLPRQTCGLYTKNIYYQDYPGGSSKLEESIAGGELFMTLVTNPISIFMSHMPNYCCDRLAPYTFESVASFVACHTNLRMRTVPPLELAKTYFRLFPEEEQAVWGNPCDDKRHLEIWSKSKTCDKLPQFLVVGPQKTGTTALSTFLQLHPSIISNYPSPHTYEEVQFFRGPNYALGLDWYMEFFPRGNSSVFMFEKSATYFDGEDVPLRVHRLIPRANIVAVILPPGDRAYSWYHHMRAHSDPTAINYTFRQVITAGPSSPKALLALQSRCLEPGKYAVHLERWLTQFRPKQLHLIDGLQLKFNPVAVMNQLQHFLQITPFFDYKESLVFDKNKGFYCQVVNGRRKCLGKGKGRSYPRMDSFSQDWLQKYYKKPNENLEKLLIRLGYEIPTWLEDDLAGAGTEKKLMQEKSVNVN